MQASFVAENGPKKKQEAHSGPNSDIATSGSNHISKYGVSKKRRKSSTNYLYSPFTRRSSLLSKSMLENETVQCYELPRYRNVWYESEDCLSEDSNRGDEHSHDRSYRFSNGYQDTKLPSFSLSLSESQGFLWNQDLFASTYQQLKAGVNSRMSMSSSHIEGLSSVDNSIEVIDIIIDDEDSGDLQSMAQFETTLVSQIPEKINILERNDTRISD